MPWWGVLLMVVGVQGIFLLVWWLLTRNKGGSISRELEDSTTKRLQDELEAERKKGEEVAAAYSSLTAKFKEVAAWYTENKDRISKEAADDFKAMAGDPSAVDAWLDSLTSNEPTTASTDPEKP